MNEADRERMCRKLRRLSSLFRFSIIAPLNCISHLAKEPAPRLPQDGGFCVACAGAMCLHMPLYFGLAADLVDVVADVIFEGHLAWFSIFGQSEQTQLSCMQVSCSGTSFAATGTAQHDRHFQTSWFLHPSG